MPALPGAEEHNERKKQLDYVRKDLTHLNKTWKADNFVSVDQARRDVAEKYKVRLEDHVVGLAKCSNPNCITNRGEPVSPEFNVISRHPPQLRCCYCDRLLTNISDNLL